MTDGLRGDGSGESASQRRAVLSLAAGAAAVVVVGLILALARPAVPVQPPGGPHATTEPRPTQAIVPLAITDRLDVGSSATSAMAVSGAVVWIATLGRTKSQAGTLYRIDRATALKTATWAVGGDPVAIASDGDFVWVANGDGDGSASLVAANTVEQFNATTGAAVHTYAVSDPRGLVASPASALVISSNAGNRTEISVLDGGVSTAISTLTGTLAVPISSLSPEVAVAVCSDDVFIALSDVVVSGSSVTIYEVPNGGGLVRTVSAIPHDYAAALTCDSTDLFLIGAAGDGDASISRVSIGDGTLKSLWEGPYPISVAFLTGRLWITYSDDAADQSLLTSLDPVTGIPGSTRSILPSPPKSGEPDLVVPDASGLWIAPSLGNTLLHIATGAAG
jgi:hypothetical protein